MSASQFVIPASNRDYFTVESTVIPLTNCNSGYSYAHSAGFIPNFCWGNVYSSYTRLTEKIDNHEVEWRISLPQSYSVWPGMPYLTTIASGMNRFDQRVSMTLPIAYIDKGNLTEGQMREAKNTSYMSVIVPANTRFRVRKLKVTQDMVPANIMAYVRVYANKGRSAEPVVIRNNVNDITHTVKGYTDIPVYTLNGVKFR